MLSAGLGGGGERLAVWKRAGGLRAPGAPAGLPRHLPQFFQPLLCAEPRASGPSLSRHFPADSAGEPRPSSGSRDWRMVGPGLRDLGQPSANRPGRPPGGGEASAEDPLGSEVRALLPRAAQGTTARAGSSRTTLLNLNREE